MFYFQGALTRNLDQLGIKPPQWWRLNLVDRVKTSGLYWLPRSRRLYEERRICWYRVSSWNQHILNRSFQAKLKSTEKKLQQALKRLADTEHQVLNSRYRFYNKPCQFQLAAVKANKDSGSTCCFCCWLANNERDGYHRIDAWIFGWCLPSRASPEAFSCCLCICPSENRTEERTEISLRTRYHSFDDIPSGWGNRPELKASNMPGWPRTRWWNATQTSPNGIGVDAAFLIQHVKAAWHLNFQQLIIFWISKCIRTVPVQRAAPSLFMPNPKASLWPFKKVKASRSWGNEISGFVEVLTHFNVKQSYGEKIDNFLIGLISFYNDLNGRMYCTVAIQCTLSGPRPIFFLLAFRLLILKVSN